MTLLRVCLTIAFAAGLTILAIAQGDNPHGDIKFDCASCHSTGNWKEIPADTKFRHDETGFPLSGKHKKIKCIACHNDLTFAKTQDECASCHADPHNGQLGSTCQNCHTTRGWQNEQEVFEVHATRGFPLMGVHAIVDCQSCHQGQLSEQYAGTSAECQSCHESDFTSTADPNHVMAGFDRDCVQCHRSSAVTWDGASFDHPPTPILDGGHQGLDCASCHATQFAGTPTDCYSCHSSDYLDAPDPDHEAANFSQDCSTCHKMTAWTPATFDHNVTSFALEGAHAKVQCQDCHSNSYTNTASDCFSCHSSAFADANEPDHTAGNFDHDCTTCHNMNAWEPADFDHSATSFALTGAHTSLACQNCHSGGYTNTASDCFSCHGSGFAATDNPDHEAADFSHDCQQCHTTTAWQPAEFDHNQTGFAIDGAHLELQCQSCHSGGYANTVNDCYSCHQMAFAAATDPNHVTNGLGHNCIGCHTTAGWVPVDPRGYDHTLTGFPLEGGHVGVDCQSCHAGGYADTSPLCFSCHSGDFARADDPDHEGGNFDHNCLTCHSNAVWSPATFDHNQTQFALTGAHQELACISCHGEGYVGTSTQCFDCHGAAFTAAADPNHVTNNFDHDCSSCHSTTAWQPSSFDHTATGFALTGAHTSADCISCHSAGYTNTPTLCFDCHSGDFAGTTDPDHESNNFDHDCTSCHSTTAWEPSSFDHSATGFILTGAHTSANCVSCHSAGYTNTPTLCFDCHSGDFAGTTDPDHELNNFDHDCTSCHSTTAWEPSSFDHATTGFVLTGAHTSTNCISCHSTGYTNTPTLCFDCHSSDFAGTTDPNHTQNNFDHNCATCHSTTAWEPADFDHSQTSFNLTGAHTSLACISCHAGGYVNTPSLCFDCHSGDFAGTTDPNHAQNNFDHNCSTCHSTSAWEPSNFNHSTTGFALTGAHTTLACISCHASGYVSTPSLCFNCHQGDFTSTTDPDHEQNNFDHNCGTCHSTTAWEPSNFDHSSTGFVLAGAHATTACVTCHAAGYTNTPNTCISCHQADVTAADNPNHASAGFDNNCATCHGASSWQPANWNHTTTGFVLLGAHTSLQCISCHSQTYVGTSQTCYGCHSGDFTAVVDPNHVTNNFDQLCTNCHGTTAWSPATFDHNLTQFPLTGGHAGLQCLTCHSTGYTNTSTACYSCHQGDFEGVTDPNHMTNNFDHNCVTCHTTTAWTPSTFNHSTTGFALTGGHTGLQCVACHSAGYTNTPADCYSCHQGDFAAVTDPNHVTNGFSHLCAECHTTTAWTPASFNHSTTNFPLTGAHVGLMCIACHSGGYVATPTLCFSCHQGAYDATTSPDHTAANFPTDCQTCHTTTAWTPANWNHDTQYFPIYSGTHREKWNNCNDCHVNAANYAVFECIFCHEHNQTDMNAKHQGRPGYSWQSAACLNCHPDGN